MQTRYKMTRIERAKQFAPFDALTGLGAALKEKIEESTLVTRSVLSEDELREINEILCVLEGGDLVRVLYFCAGTYFDNLGQVVKVDGVRKILTLAGVEEGPGAVEGIEINIPFVDVKKIERL